MDARCGARALLVTLLGTVCPMPAAAQVPDSTIRAARGPEGPVRTTTPCVVTRITDGDSIECDGVGRVRLIGMDTPELDQGRIATLATQALTRLFAVGDTVALEPDVEARDRYGRVLAYVWADGVLVNWAMVRHGWAVVLTYPPNVQYVDWFTAAQRAAQDDRAGLWAVDGFRCAPRDHRAGRC
jgi:micrococcal nuclease